MDFTTIRFEKSEKIATITLNRPGNMNTFNLTMLNELATAFEDVSLDDDIRVVIFTGEGKVFSAGADVKAADELLGIGEERQENEDIMKIITRLVLSIRQTPKPVIAALNGVTAGATANFALACDIIVASEDARLVENFINIGLVPDGGGTFLVPHLIGYHRAAEIFFTGKILSAQEAMDLGLYNRVVPKESVLDSARELARELMQKPALTLAAGKRIINMETIPRLRAHLEEETDEQRVLARSHDTQEGIMAFIEKREPDFIGK
ncbi:enoyl-CoA hydratase/isomerase family protein [Thermodesulfobacteriota bacterium]